MRVAVWRHLFRVSAPGGFASALGEAVPSVSPFSRAPILFLEIVIPGPRVSSRERTNAGTLLKRFSTGTIGG